MLGADGLEVISYQIGLEKIFGTFIINTTVKVFNLSG